MSKNEQKKPGVTTRASVTDNASELSKQLLGNQNAAINTQSRPKSSKRK